jgi:hypothetical protein
MAKVKAKKQKEMTVEEKQADRVKRHETHAAKRTTAMSRLAAKVDALGDDAMLDEYELCAFLGKSVQWARNRRIYGGSLPFRKYGSAVRYRLGDIKAAV